MAEAYGFLTRWLRKRRAAKGKGDNFWTRPVFTLDGGTGRIHLGRWRPPEEDNGDQSRLR